MNILSKTVILGLSATCLGTAGNIQTAHAAAKVTQYKNLKTAQYVVARDSKGYLYKQATLKTKLHNIKKYSKVKFTVSKEAFVKRSNGKNAVYYYVKSSKVSGWLWHGYLTKVSAKKSTMGLDTSQNKQIASLQRQVSDLKQQLSELKIQHSSTTTALQASAPTNVSLQIASLQNQINMLKSPETNTDTNNETNNNSTNTEDNNTTATDNSGKESSSADPFTGTPTEYYTDFNTIHIYFYSNENQKYASILGTDPNSGTVDSVKTLEVYTNPITSENDTYWHGVKYGSHYNMIPVSYNGEKGYIETNDMSIVPVNTQFRQFGDTPDNAGFGNEAPTEVKFPMPLVTSAIWLQYTRDTKNSSNCLYWRYNAATKTWNLEG